MAKVELELLKNIDMLLMVEKEIIGRICHSINRYPKANYKYIITFMVGQYHKRCL